RMLARFACTGVAILCGGLGARVTATPSGNGGAEPAARPPVRLLTADPAPQPAVLAPAPRVHAQSGAPELLQQGQYKRLRFERPILDISIGDPEIAAVELDNDRELLLLGRKPGSTNLILGFESGPVEVPITVLMDLGVLSSALADVHPSITAHKAPDREAVVLLGRVPLAVYAQRAEDIARRYLEASSPEGEFLVGDAAESVASEQSRAGRDQRRRTRTVSVINLIRIDSLPESLGTKSAEEKIMEAISGLRDHDVRVRRVMKGRLPDDEQDLLILEGTVPDQVSLVRVLSIAYKVFYGARKDVNERVTDGITNQVTEYEGDIRSLADDLEVIADEAGALVGIDDAGGNTGDRQLLSGFGTGSSGSNRSGIANGGLRNKIQNNLGRAKAIELADGRLLSFIEVEDLPQVRVDLRLYEVNRTALFEYESDLALLLSDFDQGGLSPAGVATAVQGTNAASVGASGKAIQNALGFLNGKASNQLQISGSKAALDSLFSLLEKEEVARSLAKPSLTVLSGETAVFEVGGEVPIDQSFATNDVGANGVFNGVSFIQFGIKLAIRPLVDEKDFVTIDFAPEVTAPDAFLTAALATATGENPSTFAFESRLLRTSARMLDGATLLVGGLSQKNRRDASAQVPWINKVPLLGLLFQNFDYSDDDLELVVMVRVSIVRDPIPEASLWAFPGTNEMLDAVMPIPVLPPPPPRVPSGEPEDVETNVDEPAATDEVPSARLETDDDAYFADEPGVAYRTDYDDEPFVKGRVR
ncbi:MAG: pilus assembly protein N-terminal domain-containing protein, partial [Planctomycetes bacterium]|nr:pilus assembly protein N-terminal domain-containing protein [Planctomycetota bacterium]